MESVSYAIVTMDSKVEISNSIKNKKSTTFGQLHHEPILIKEEFPTVCKLDNYVILN